MEESCQTSRIDGFEATGSTCTSLTGSLMKTTTHRPAAVASAVRVPVVLEAVVFLLATLLRTGVRTPVGFAILAELRIVPVMIVEGLCGLFLAVSAYALFTRRSWAWPAATGAHASALAGVGLRVAGR
jgi:hypothetical protein